VRAWLRAGRSLDGLNALAEAGGIRTEAGKPVRFVPPATGKNSYYELQVYESGRVATRADSLHDWFNALAWLAFPRTKARINAMHAEQIPRERGRRGRLRDLLTLFDEGGAIVRCDDAGLIAMLREFRWKELFWEHRSRVLSSMRVVVFGHAVLEMALEPWPGITCKAIFVAVEGDADAQAAAWLARLPLDATPQELAALPVFGYPGWLAGSDRAGFYDDVRHFRPFRKQLEG
jgi:hypothetical protein